MLQRKAVRQGADGRFHASGKPAKRQQEQILLRLKAGSARHGVPFADKLANAVAQLGEGLVFRGGDFFRHERTISQCDICFHLSALKSVISTGGTAVFAVAERRNLSSTSKFSVTAACEMIFGSCNARIRGVRRTGARARESRSSAPTCLYSHACVPNLPRRPATTCLLPGSAALLRRPAHSLQREFPLREAAACSRASSRSPHIPASPPRIPRAARRA